MFVVYSMRTRCFVGTQWLKTTFPNEEANYFVTIINSKKTGKLLSH